MAKINFPTEEEFAKNIAEKVLDEYLIEWKTLREWIKIIAEQEPKTGWIPVTNGDMLKATFPTTQIRINGDFISFTLDGIVGTTVETKWWNAPYQSEVSE